MAIINSTLLVITPARQLQDFGLDFVAAAPASGDGMGVTSDVEAEKGEIGIQKS